MTDFEKTEFSAAISLALESIRPSSMMAHVLEAMVNKEPNGLPQLTYDLEVSNMKYADTDLVVPSIWELIGLDVAPYPNLWDRVNYARDNSKAIRNAVYGLKEWFESFGNYHDEEGNQTATPITLFIFNKNGADNKETNVITADPSYANALNMCQGKATKLMRGKVVKTANRLRLNKRNEAQIVSELASALNNARIAASLPKGLGDKIKSLESS